MSGADRPVRVRLRPITLDDVALVDRWEADPVAHGEFNDFGVAGHSIGDDVARGRVVDHLHGTLLIERVDDAAPIGTVSWRPVQYGPGTESRAWQLGIALVPEARRKGLGTEVHLLIAEHLFATTDAFRVEASTDVENVAEQRALEKAGFRREGVNRMAQFRAGARHDLVLYARLRTDV